MLQWVGEPVSIEVPTNFPSFTSHTGGTHEQMGVKYCVWMSIPHLYKRHHGPYRGSSHARISLTAFVVPCLHSGTSSMCGVCTRHCGWTKSSSKSPQRPSLSCSTCPDHQRTGQVMRTVSFLSSVRGWIIRSHNYNCCYLTFTKHKEDIITTTFRQVWVWASTQTELFHLRNIVLGRYSYFFNLN